MANSRFEYVKQFEQHDTCLMDTFIVLRIDGKGFSKFSQENSFEKPNDLKALNVMNKAALALCEQFRDIFLAYGQSDEYSFVFDRKTDIFNRRNEKIISISVSIFTAAYLNYFLKEFQREPINLPIFDCRIILYPTFKIMKHYFSWRQADCHINNLYNTCFWELIQTDKKTNKEAEQYLKGTFSDFKNEYLFQKGINYSKIEDIYKKGSLIKRQFKCSDEKMKKYEEIKLKNPKAKPPRKKYNFVVVHEDLIQQKFWDENFPELLSEDVQLIYYQFNISNF